jgi:general secretion pathway protein E
MAAVLDRFLDLRGVIQDLIRANRMSREDGNRLLGLSRTHEQAVMHPLNYIASQNVEDQERIGKLLDIEVLTQWLATEAGLPCFHIDPMKIDVAKCTEVMGYAFAKRHGILCVQVLKDEVLVAWNPRLSMLLAAKSKKCLPIPVMSFATWWSSTLSRVQSPTLQAQPHRWSLILNN